jgi:hypothetical protein
MEVSLLSRDSVQGERYFESMAWSSGVMVAKSKENFPEEQWMKGITSIIKKAAMYSHTPQLPS